MGKGQSLVIQFVLFFIIGFAMFIAIGNFFKLQSDDIRIDVGELSTRLTSSYLNSRIIRLIDSCKECNFGNFTFRLENTSAGYNTLITVGPKWILTEISPLSKLTNSTVYNLLLSTNTQAGLASSAEPIIITYNKTKNQLILSKP